MVRSNIVYDLLLKKTKLSSGITDIKSDRRIYFVICNSCYWCASYFMMNEKLNLSPACNLCKSCDTEIIPISADESFTIEHSQTRGLEIEFHKK